MKHIVQEVNRNWYLKEVSSNQKHSAKVPGSVLETLFEHNVIQDPFYGVNEKECQWVFETDWEYSTTINLSKDMLKRNYIMLRFYGLDTYCEVTLNDRIILFGDNMHRTFDVYIKTHDYNFLEEGDNELTIIFRSPINEARKRIEEAGLELNQDTRNLLPFAIPGVEMLRKAYYSFGWDWGPKFPDSGIWRKIELHAFNDSYIKGVQIQTEIDFIIGDGNGKTTAKEAKVKLETELEDFQDNKEKIIIYELYDGKTLINKQKTNTIKLGTEMNLIINNPKLWWTHELGKPNLYHLKIKLLDKDQLLDEYSTDFGIREIQLIRNKDKWGESFYFELNKIPVFAKGGNWVPSDSFLPRGNRNKNYERILDACIKANMNMIRIWGGGIYEEEAFYHYCDQNGLMIWQDFAFACRPTPNYSGFEESVIQEAVDNIKRLRNHPSLAIWVGNNEIEEGWLYWGFEQFVP